MLNFLIWFNLRLKPLPGEFIEGGEDEALGAVLAILLELVGLERGECHGGTIGGIFGRGVQDVGQFLTRQAVELGVVGIQLRLELGAAAFIPWEGFARVPQSLRQRSHAVGCVAQLQNSGGDVGNVVFGVGRGRKEWKLLNVKEVNMRSSYFHTQTKIHH